MKLKLTTKLLIGTSLAMVAIAPTLTLTSCASISQWSLPIIIGGNGEKSPWSDLNQTTKDEYDLNNIFKQNMDTDPTNYDYYSPRAQFSSYLPDSFISYTDRSSGTNNYEFASAYNDVNWNNKTNVSSYYDSQWLDPSNEHLLQMSKTCDVGSGDNKKSLGIFTSIQNANLYNALSFNSIALGINLFTSGILRLMAQDGVMNSQSNQDWYSALFGGIGSTGFFDHGDKTSDKNKTFYEFLFDLLDLLSQGKFAGKFGQSAIDYKFSSYVYGPGPYISWNNESNDGLFNPLKQFVGWETQGSNQFTFNEANIQKNPTDDKVIEDGVLSNKFCNNNATQQQQIAGVPSARGAYTAFAPSNSNNNYPDQNNTYYASSIPVQIPFIINPGDFTYSYYNPLTKHSYQQNDYLLDDIAPVQKQVAKTNAWKTFANHVSGVDKNKWVDSLSMKFTNDSRSTIDETNKFYDLPGDSAENLLDKLNDGKSDDQKASYIDPTTYYILKGQTMGGQPILTTKVLQPNSYIGFANYSFALFPRHTDDANNVVYDSMPIFAGVAQNSDGIPAVFPVSLLFNNDTINSNGSFDHDPTNIDLSLWTRKLLPEANALLNYQPTKDADKIWNNDTFKNASANNIYYLDLEKLFKKETDTYSFLSTNIDLKKSPSSYYDSDGNIKNMFQTIWHLLGNWKYDDNVWKLEKTDSDSLIQRVS